MFLIHLQHNQTVQQNLEIIIKHFNLEKRTGVGGGGGGGGRENSKTLFYKNCSLGSFKNLSNTVTLS